LTSQQNGNILVGGRYGELGVERPIPGNSHPDHCHYWLRKVSPVGNESVQKIITVNTIYLLLKSAISVLVISTYGAPSVITVSECCSKKIASVYLI